jgi:hypothetical protein
MFNKATSGVGLFFCPFVSSYLNIQAQNENEIFKPNVKTFLTGVYKKIELIRSTQTLHWPNSASGKHYVGLGPML